MYRIGKFLSTPSVRRATISTHQGGIIIAISIHALREEGDLSYSVGLGAVHAFLSTPSVRRATTLFHRLELLTDISIHALREEGDVVAIVHIVAQCNFYPRPP